MLYPIQVRFNAFSFVFTCVPSPTFPPLSTWIEFSAIYLLQLWEFRRCNWNNVRDKSLRCEILDFFFIMTKLSCELEHFTRIAIWMRELFVSHQGTLIDIFLFASSIVAGKVKHWNILCDLWWLNSNSFSIFKCTTRLNNDSIDRLLLSFLHLIQWTLSQLWPRASVKNGWRLNKKILTVHLKNTDSYKQGFTVLHLLRISFDICRK